MLLLLAISIGYERIPLLAEQRNFSRQTEEFFVRAEEFRGGTAEFGSLGFRRRAQRKAALVNSGDRDTLSGINSVPPVQRFPDALVWLTLMADLVWLWVVYRVDSDAVFGAIRRAERLYTTAEEARSVVGQVADRMGAGEIRWEQTDEATWVARTTRYVCVVWSIRLPE